MKFAILCLCLASMASAAPSPFHYISHYGPRQQLPPSAVRNTYLAPQSLPHLGAGLPAAHGAYSVELIYPHAFAGGAGGADVPSLGLIKYSIPQPPGRQSLEYYYPYDFVQQRVLTSMPPMANVPQTQNMAPYPHQNIPQPIPNIPHFDANIIPSQDPLQPHQQDQPTQTSQVPPKV